MFRKLHEANAAPGGPMVIILIDGEPVRAREGDTVAAVLLRQVEPWSRLSPVSRSRRAPYCMMGVCFECVAEIDGVASTQTCLTVVRDGMHVVRQHGRRRLDHG